MAALVTCVLQPSGAGRAGPLLQFAKLVSPQEALQLGLVDRVVPPSQLLPAAEAAMKQVRLNGVSQTVDILTWSTQPAQMPMWLCRVLRAT